MADLMRCNSCGGFGDILTNCDQDGNFDIQSCPHCSGFGFVTESQQEKAFESSNAKRAKIIANALRVVDETKAKMKGGKL